ncbi:MAG TPA: quinone-dependent dihydroorotate dehydrogenase [Solirubrobacteraceae bacterium]|nr:quinone-dependent dihydroorotate dehydrogenase [Solirubrobacteraceae bacterium]
MRIYRVFFRLLILARVDGERAHRLAGAALAATMAIPGVRRAASRVLAARDPRLRVRALGMVFPSPLGLAAGVDGNASLFEDFGALGFGFVEVGTVTALRQPGNAGPRVFRLPADRAILNRRGFPNDGASAAAERLRARPREPIVGVNVGKSRDVPVERAHEDYRASVRQLAPLADYLVLNVSSPNTPGLRDLQSAKALRALIADVREELELLGARVPLLIKIAPDVSDEQLDAIAELALELGLDGIVAVNTTVDRGALTVPAALPAGVEDGGISGPPLAPRALAVLRRLRARVGETVTLVSVGGVQTPQDAWERLAAGATLVQAHTAFVYNGPLWPTHVNRGLARRARAAGLSSIEQLIGSEAPAAAADASQQSAAHETAPIAAHGR